MTEFVNEALKLLISKSEEMLKEFEEMEVIECQTELQFLMNPKNT